MVPVRGPSVSEGPPLPIPVLRLAALLTGLLGPPGSLAELPATVSVASETLAAHVEPDERSAAPETLRKGDKVRAIDSDPTSGWLTIEAPTSAFAWIEKGAVQTVSRGVGRVSAPRTLIRAGVAGARMIGPPGSLLMKGATVWFLDRPELSLGKGPKATTWLAIASPADGVRYVRSSGVSWPETKGPEPPSEVRAAYEEPARPSETGIAPEFAGDVARIESDHRAVLNEPVERWQLDSIRARYEALLKRAPDSATADALRGRLALVAGHEEVGRSARMVATLLDRSRRRDQEVAMAREKLVAISEPRRRPFVAEGLMERSSREVEGHRVYALIGSDGNPTAYLDVPPGLDARPALSKRVGVRGNVRYNEKLGTRLIAVKDLEPLE